MVQGARGDARLSQEVLVLVRLSQEVRRSCLLVSGSGGCQARDVVWLGSIARQEMLFGSGALPDRRCHLPRECRQARYCLARECCKVRAVAWLWRLTGGRSCWENADRFEVFAISVRGTCRLHRCCRYVSAICALPSHAKS